MPLLSIIIPVFNKEPYIDDCIQSILNQTFTDFELILVNDGSSDNSGAVCAKYEAQDDRVILINQHNAGASAARNTGLTKATGRYIGFIDSDDTIEPDMYELLVNNAQDHDADISVCRLRVFLPGKTLAPEESKGIAVFDHDQALSACLRGDLDRSANNKIYKSALAKSIQFEGQMYEDILYTCKAFIAAQKTVYENVVKYNYLVRDNSVSMSSFSPKYMQTVDVSGKIVKLVAQNDKQCLPEAKIFDVIANISLLNLMLMADRNQYLPYYKQVVDTLLGYKPFIKQTVAIAKKYKYAYKAFSISPRLYTWLMYMYCRLTQSELIKRTQNQTSTA